MFVHACMWISNRLKPALPLRKNNSTLVAAALSELQTHKRGDRGNQRSEGGTNVAVTGLLFKGVEQIKKNIQHSMGVTEIFVLHYHGFCVPDIDSV